MSDFLFVSVVSHLKKIYFTSRDFTLSISARKFGENSHFLLMNGFLDIFLIFSQQKGKNSQISPEFGQHKCT